MIQDFTVTADAAGFPIVSWIETRNSFASRGSGREPVTCRIMKDGATGVLLFVASGAKRRGDYHEARPWESLRGLSLRPAAGIYPSPDELTAIQSLSRKKPHHGPLLADPGQVVLAEFTRRADIHVNGAEASRADMDALHAALVHVFLTQRHEVAAHLCETMYQWPIGDDRVVTFDPDARPAPVEPDAVSRRAALIKAGLVAIGLIAAIVALRALELL